MAGIFLALALCASLSPQAAGAAGTVSNYNHDQASRSSAQAVNPVVQWNRNLLLIVRTPGVQPATVHPTLSFAIMHAAIYDAVNSIDRTHRPYLVRLSDAPRDASQEAAAAAAAHRVLVGLYPTLKSTLDTELLQSLAQIPDGERKTEGILVGQTVADRILALRDNDGSNAQPIPYVFGSAPGDYESTTPNFPAQPQFTHWSHVTPFRAGACKSVSTWPSAGSDQRSVQ